MITLFKMKSLLRQIVLTMICTIALHSQASRDSSIMDWYLQGRITKDSMYHKLFDAGKIDDAFYLDNLSESQRSIGVGRIQRKKEARFTQRLPLYHSALENMSKQAQCPFALKAVLATLDSQQIFETVLDPDLPRLSREKQNDAVEIYLFSSSLFTVYRCQHASTQRYVIDKYLVDGGELLLLATDTLHPNIISSYPYEGSAERVVINSVPIFKITRRARGTGLDYPAVEYLAISEGKFEKVFEIYPYTLKEDHGIITRTMTDVIFKDVNNDSMIDLVTKKFIDVIRITKDIDPTKLASIRNAKVIKHVVTEETLYVWDKIFGNFQIVPKLP